MHEFKIKFYLPPDSNNPHEPRTVQARIYLDNQRDYLTATKVVVTDRVWNAGLEKVKLNTPEGHLMNHRLDILRKQVTDIYHLYAADEHLSLALIKQAYLTHVKKMSGRHGVCAFFNQYIKENAEVITPDSRRHLVLVANLFKQFVSHTYKTEDIDFTDITQRMLHDFESYLHEEEGYTHNRTLQNKISILKTFLGAARELGMMEDNPFDGYCSLGILPVRNVYLSIEEIKYLKRAEFPTKRLEKVRDYFLFSCYTGLSYIEIKSLTKKNLTQLNGSTWILLTGESNDSLRYIPLLPYTASIINKYTSDNATLLPIISQQKTNKYLKEIAEICGLNKPLTFQLAAQSFMKIALNAGASIDSISHMLGKPLRHVKPFARLSPERIEDEMAMFAAKMGRDRHSNIE